MTCEQYYGRAFFLSKQDFWCQTPLWRKSEDINIELFFAELFVC